MEVNGVLNGGFLVTKKEEAPETAIDICSV